jgi:branched-subunit amino acid transport protein
VRLWLAVLGMGAVTYLTRAAPLLFLHGRRLPPGLLRALRLVPAAVLSALIAPELLQPGGAVELGWGNLRLLAGIVAIVVAWRTRNVFVTTVSGLASLWVLQALVG